MAATQFDTADFHDELPPAGAYHATIVAARLHRGMFGSLALVAIIALDGVTAGRDRACERFGLEGGDPHRVSAARRRLVYLHQACGLAPKAGDEIEPAALLGKRLAVTVDHDHRTGEPRLRIRSYSPWREHRQPLLVCGCQSQR